MSIETALLGLLGPAPGHDDPRGRSTGPQWSHLVRHLEEEAPSELARWAAALDVPGVVGRAATGRPRPRAVVMSGPAPGLGCSGGLDRVVRSGS